MWVEMLRPASSRIARSPDDAESRARLDQVHRTRGDFRPHAVLTYGGNPTKPR